VSKRLEARGGGAGVRHLGEVKEPRNFVRNNVFARRGAREGWEDGTPPPHRDFKKRGVMR